jgi:hypothetical protein
MRALLRGEGKKAQIGFWPQTPHAFSLCHADNFHLKRFNLNSHWTHSFILSVCMDARASRSFFSREMKLCEIIGESSEFVTREANANKRLFLQLENIQSRFFSVGVFCLHNEVNNATAVLLKQFIPKRPPQSSYFSFLFLMKTAVSLKCKWIFFFNIYFMCY